MFNQKKIFQQLQKMQSDMQKLQSEIDAVNEELETLTVQATSGGGVVVAEANGQRKLTRIQIQPDAVDPQDVEMLEDLVLAAANEALRKAKEMADAEMAKVTSKFKLPAGLPDF